ncbi:carotenoid oxygenase family protein [Microcoleus sp. B9-D4]|uniref:carotenoid oxygenase family protein n=1 Tax=Microcoleus sp. B9-D4 TaxID=2818711 RepID=UPI002FD5E336
MNEPTQSNTKAGCPPVPQSIMSASREELDDIPMNIKGELPEEVQGYIFIVAPVGTVESGGLPFADGDSFLNGDGMIYRLDFNQKGQVILKTRIAKPLDYHFDEATKGSKLGFRNHGILRFSLLLGARNELNTAFLPVKFLKDEQERLLVTYDAGRPYEIDTDTLHLVTPVGSNKEWRPEAPLPYLFPPIFSTAHPTFDTYTGDMFAVNYGRSLENFLETIPSIEKIDERFPGVRLFWEKFKGLEDFVYLIRWDGVNQLERWTLVNPDGSPVSIKQTIHQIGVTENYVILMDTAFSTGLEQLLTNPFPENKELERILRELLESPPSPDSIIYIVSRSDLQKGKGQRPALNEPEVKVVARKVVIPLEAAHFLVDYENPNEKITLHVAHICAWDVAEWLRQYDISPYQPHNPVPKNLPGMELNEMDISRLGRYVIDLNNQDQTIEPKVIWDTEYTWGLGLYAYLDRLPSGKTPRKLDNIYWISFGLWKDLTTEFLCHLYRDYKYQKVPQSDVLALAEKGVPACLLRLDTQSMEIADRYQFDPGYIVSSPQFMPRRGNQGSSTDGYIVCTVFTPQRNEIWIFEADNLSGGPKCKLSHKSLDFTFTLHTAWLQQIGPRSAKYKISLPEDYEELAKNFQSPPEFEKEIQELFAKELYPRFESE